MAYRKLGVDTKHRRSMLANLTKDLIMNGKIVTTETPPAAFLIKQVAKVKKASSKGANEVVGSITKAQLKEIAETKLPDLNAYDVEHAMNIIAGTAKNMGIEVKED